MPGCWTGCEAHRVPIAITSGKDRVPQPQADPPRLPDREHCHLKSRFTVSNQRTLSPSGDVTGGPRPINGGPPLTWPGAITLPPPPPPTFSPSWSSSSEIIRHLLIFSHFISTLGIFFLVCVQLYYLFPRKESVSVQKESGKESASKLIERERESDAIFLFSPQRSIDSENRAVGGGRWAERGCQWRLEGENRGASLKAVSHEIFFAWNQRLGMRQSICNIVHRAARNSFNKVHVSFSISRPNYGEKLDKTGKVTMHMVDSSRAHWRDVGRHTVTWPHP